ncbi:MAG: hypothetical protein HYS13_05110 [Planctomycetia bacterium]|nr:hypothetical protein [Planctomycetia bacterium]
MPSGRNANGKFAPGNLGGPGRPRRAVERDYLAALSDAVSLDDWKAVVARAVADAKAGDARARDWLSRHVLGADPPSLKGLATAEAAGITAEAELEAEARQRATFDRLMGQLADADGPANP